MMDRKSASFEGKRRRAQQPYLQVVEADRLQGGEPYDGVGADMRAARVEHGYSLQEISSRLRIQLDYLEAIEAGQFEALPGPAYAIGFLRSYANALGMDGEDVVLRFKSESAVVPGQTKLVFPTPVQEARRPGAAVVAASLAVAVAGYVGWAYLQQESRLPVELIPEPPQRLTTVLDQLERQQTSAVPSATWSVSQPAVGATAATSRDGNSEETPADPAPSAEAQAQAVAVAAEAERDAAATQTPDAAGTVAETDRTAAEAPPEAEAPSTDLAAADEPAANEFAADGSASDDATAVGTPADARDAQDLVVAEADTATETVNAEPGADAGDESIRPDLPETTAFSGLPAVDATVPAPADLASEDAPADDGDLPERPAFATTMVLPEPPALPAAPDVAAPTADLGGPPSIPTSATATESYVPQIFGSANRNARVVVRAKSDAWVQVQGANNELLLTRILRAGDTYMAPDRSDLTLMTGNAGALEAIVDGALVGALGPEGQVRRDISLDADKLLGDSRDSG